MLHIDTNVYLNLYTMLELKKETLVKPPRLHVAIICFGFIGTFLLLVNLIIMLIDKHGHGTSWLFIIALIISLSANVLEICFKVGGPKNARTVRSFLPMKIILLVIVIILHFA